MMRTYFREQVCLVGLVVTLLAFFVLHYSHWGMVRYRRSVAIMGIKHHKRHHTKHLVHEAVQKDHIGVLVYLKNDKFGKHVNISQRKSPRDRHKGLRDHTALKYPTETPLVGRHDSAIHKPRKGAFVKAFGKVKYGPHGAITRAPHNVGGFRKHAGVHGVKANDVLKYRHPGKINPRKRVGARQHRKGVAVHARIGW